MYLNYRFDDRWSPTLHLITLPLHEAQRHLPHKDLWICGLGERHLQTQTRKMRLARPAGRFITNHWINDI